MACGIRAFLAFGASEIEKIAANFIDLTSGFLSYHTYNTFD